MYVHCWVEPHLQQELERALKRVCGPPWRDDLLRCVPMLVTLACQMDEAPADRLAHAARTMIVEHCFADVRGDGGSGKWVTVERVTCRVVDRLLALRDRHHLRRVPQTPPQMFG